MNIGEGVRYGEKQAVRPMENFLDQDPTQETAGKPPACLL